MALKQAFRHPDGVELVLETANFDSISPADTAFASLPADVQTVAAAHSGLADWRMGTIRKGPAQSFWFSVAGADGPAIA